MWEIPPGHRERLSALATPRAFDGGARVFEEGEPADRFWIIRTGTVELDLTGRGGRRVVVESLGAGALLGWSWMVPPRRWHLGAGCSSPVRAFEFDAGQVRQVCEEDPDLDRALCHYVGGVIAHRLRSARIRLLEV
jgi:CRP-like cAMP-binding protein